MSNLVLTGPEVGPGEPPQASIRCNYTVQFKISNSYNVSLRGLDIQSCGGPNTHPFTLLVAIRLLSYTMLFDNVHSLVVENLWMRQNHGSGLVAYNCFEHVSIRDCHFDGNYYRSLSGLVLTSGNAMIYYDTATRGHTNIDVVNSGFFHGQSQYWFYEPAVGGSGGLNVFFTIAAPKTIHVFNISVTNCSFVSNSGNFGGNMYVRHESSALININLFIQYSSFINGTSGRVGGGLGIHTQGGGSFNIINSTFTHNYVISSVGKYSHGGGVHIEMDVSSNVTIVASRFTKNFANIGGGFYISITEGRGNGGVKSNVLMSDVLFNRNIAKKDGGHGYILVLLSDCYQGVVLYSVSGCLFEKGHATRGGAISINIWHILCDKYSPRIQTYTVKVINSKLIGNSAQYGAAFYVYSESRDLEYLITRIHLSGMHIANNTALVSIIHISAERHTVLITSKTTFYNNTITPLKYTGAILYLKKLSYSWIRDTIFSNNIGSCTRLISSNIFLKGNVQFHNNTAYAGAALLLDCQIDSLNTLDSIQPSFLVLLPNTTVTIANNTALYYGGGLAVNPVCNYNSSCFFRASSFVNTVVYLYDNKALISANSIYGPPMTHCVNQGGQIGGRAAFTTLFKVEGGYSSDEVVLSAVNSICFCNDNPFTCNTELEVHIWPGEEFSVLAMTTGELDDNSSNYIRASLIDVDSVDNTSKLGNSKFQEIQELKRSCDKLTYSVVTSTQRVKIKIQIDLDLNAFPSFINIVVRKCTLGFQLGLHKESCVCSEYLVSQLHEITCDIQTGEISVPGKVWVGIYSDKLAVHKHCPLDYCSPEPHSVNLQRQHLQCTSNRSGVLCGGCQTGLSIGLGTARCLDNCSNYHLFLVFPFALAGLTFVFILLKCNFTVSVGTINSLIFYANIVHVNRTIFFPQDQLLFLTNMLAVFIAWLNLDLGIETCFGRDMTAYVNTWLQFAFPVYIWVLVLVMIYSSRYSVTTSKIIGRNAVSVLATLFLLSYTKLLRTVIAAVSSTSLGDEDGRSHLLWLMDGNVAYFSAPHAVLFFTALLAVLLYILPLTLLTLMAPCLQARTNHQMMRWVVRIKPLLDTYQGPYKDKYRHWTGVMLLLRLVLFAVFSANTLGNPNINVFAVSTSVIAVHLYQIYVGRLYKNWVNWFVEGFYSCNLAVFSMAVLFLNASQGSSEALACVMVGSAFFVFCLVVVWHFNHQTRAISRAGERLKQLWTSRRRRKAVDTQEPTDPPPRQPQPTVSVIDMKELREPLLTDN